MSTVTTLSDKANREVHESATPLPVLITKEQRHQPTQQHYSKYSQNNSQTKKLSFFNETVYISDSVYNAIVKTVGSRRPETGMVLGSSDNHIIDKCYFDESASVSGATYSPNVEFINKIVLPAWNAEGIRMVGFVHSHPCGGTPSAGDAYYASNLLPALRDLKVLALPIVRSKTSGSFEMRFFVARMDITGNATITPCNYKVVSPESNVKKPDCLSLEAWSRIDRVFPPDVMNRKTVVIIGCGGASEYAESLARCGVGRMVLFDGDIYETPNIATQQTYLDDLGKNKAEALKGRIHRINPQCEVEAVPYFLDDSIEDEQFVELVGSDRLHNHPKDVLIAGCTDNFFAQVRASQLAMKYGSPYMAAQVYEGGLGAEVLFTYPGVTESCPRCMLRSRYDQYLKNGYKNTVSSSQTPIFATQRVNSLKGHISAMLLLYGETTSSRYSTELDRVADRNFAIIRMSDQLEMPFFEGTFSSISQAFYDETLWIETTPGDGINGHFLCPDCGGEGLIVLSNPIADTRIIRLDTDGQDRSITNQSSEFKDAVLSDTSTKPEVDANYETMEYQKPQKQVKPTVVSRLRKHTYRLGIAASLLIACIGIGLVVVLQHNAGSTEGATASGVTPLTTIPSTDRSGSDDVNPNSAAINNASPQTVEPLSQITVPTEGTEQDALDKSMNRTGTGSTTIENHFVLTLEPRLGTTPWTEVDMDGTSNIIFDLLGEKRELEVTQSCTIRTGQPGNLTVLRDGVPIEWVIGNGGTGSLNLEASEE